MAPIFGSSLLFEKVMNDCVHSLKTVNFRKIKLFDLHECNKMQILWQSWTEFNITCHNMGN